MGNKDTAIARLVRSGVESICPTDRLSSIAHASEIVDSVLRVKNGFYAHNNALLVRPLHSCSDILGLAEWNEMGCWKSEYDVDLANHSFFAENIFGEQYSLTDEGVFFFESETGNIEKFADNLEQWAQKIESDPFLHAGAGLAASWQSEHRPLRPGERLGPRIPFVAGGAFSNDNLVAINDIALMKFCAQIANQIADLPDGATIRFEISE